MPPTGADAAAGAKRPLDASHGDAQGDRAKRAHTEAPQSDTVLRLLVPADHLASLQQVAGGSSGGEGSALETAARGTGATVRLISETPGCDERLVVIYSQAESGNSGSSAAGDPETGARAALQRLASALLADSGSGGAAAGDEPPPPPPPPGRRRRVRLLVSASQAASLTDADSAALAAIQDGTGVQLEVHACARVRFYVQPRLSQDEPPQGPAQQLAAAHSARSHGSSHRLALPLTCPMHAAQVQAAELAPTCACEGDRAVEASCEGSAEQLLAALARLSGHLARHPARRRPRGVSIELKATLELAEAAAG